MGQVAAASRIVVGVDIGLDGGVAVLDGTAPPRLFPMPVLRVQRGKKQRREYDVNSVITWFGGLDLQCLEQKQSKLVVLERVSAMPGQGSASGFTFGFGAGMLHGIIRTLGFPLELVEPQVWKRYFGLLGTKKDAAVAEAARQFPGMTFDHLNKAMAGGLADAMLIALWARRTR